jgi:hypothetical protein
MVNSNDEFFNSVVGINNEVEAAPTDGVEQENQSGAKDFSRRDYLYFSCWSHELHW